MGERGHRVNVNYHQWMLEDEVRNQALEAMIEALVRPGDVVADLGTGTGILAALAARAGAARVYAVDASPIVRLARQMAADNGLDNITFIEGDIATVDLPEPVDVAFSECLGNFAFGDAMFGALHTFRERSMRPGGRVGPVEVRLFGQPIDARLNWRPAKFWQTPWRGLDLSAFSQGDAEFVRVIGAVPSFLSAEPKEILTFDPWDRADGYTLSQSWTLGRDRIVNGVCVWFDVDWAPGQTMTTAATAEETHWSQGLFPFPQREACAGDTIELTIAIAFDEHEKPAYTWSNVWRSADGTIIERHECRDFEHFGPPMDSSESV
jgi:SAM-dependent methyltransferase